MISLLNHTGQHLLPDALENFQHISSHSTVRILLVDDRTLKLRPASTLLQQMGFQVEVAIGGADALEQSVWNDFDLVLVDLEMPGTDGSETMRQIRRIQESRKRRVRIVAMTSHDSVWNLQNARSKGIDDFLSKPLCADEFLRLIKRLNEADPRPEIEATNPWSLDASSIRSAYPMSSKAMGLVVKLFRESCVEKLEKMHEAHDRQDADSIARDLHALKGSLAMFASPRTMEIVKKLEGLTRSQELGQVNELLLTFEQAIEQLQPTLHLLSENLEASPLS